MGARKLAVGVIGTGHMGSRHADNLAHRVAAAEVVAIMDVDKARAAMVAEACGGATVFTNASALIDDASVDAVVITSPDNTHADLAVACIKAGKPVLCEKPLGIDIGDARRVLEAEVEHGARLVQVGLMRNYDPRHVALKSAIDSGTIGRPVLFRGIHKNVRIDRPRTAVDVIVNSAVHDIHSARWLMGDEVQFAYANHVVDIADRPETARLTLLQLVFQRGGVATIEVDADSNFGYEVRVEVAGERGTLRTPEDPKGTILQHDGVESYAVVVDWLVRFETAYRLEAEAWVRAALDGKSTGATVWDGYAAMRVAEAAALSLDSGRAERVPDEPRPDLYKAA